MAFTRSGFSVRIHLGRDRLCFAHETIDGDTAQVGPGLACRLSLPYATCVQKTRKVDEHHIEVERMMDDGFDVLRLPLPVLEQIGRAHV